MILDYSVILIFGLVVVLMLLQAYVRYFKTNDTGDFDVMEAYCNEAVRQRYQAKKTKNLYV